jgi:hypothetical protein
LRKSKRPNWLKGGVFGPKAKATNIFNKRKGAPANIFVVKRGPRRLRA